MPPFHLCEDEPYYPSLETTEADTHGKCDPLWINEEDTRKHMFWFSLDKGYTASLHALVYIKCPRDHNVSI